jgi:hypothetical protein
MVCVVCSGARKEREREKLDESFATELGFEGCWRGDDGQKMSTEKKWTEKDRYDERVNFVLRRL